MSLAFWLKNNLNGIPYSIGKFASVIPYDFRPGLGNSYRKGKDEINHLSDLTNMESKAYIFSQVCNQTLKAFNEIPFYNNYYKKLNFNPFQLKSYEDIQSIPIINKELLLEWDLEERSNNKYSGAKVNTGGSSGKTLNLIIPKEKMGREWAHLHKVWKYQMDFTYTDMKLMLMGTSDLNDYIEYDFLRHSLRLDIYKSLDEISNDFEKRIKKFPIRYLHGYPSAIYEFALYCRSKPDLLNYFIENLRGVILNSEYPQHYQRTIIEETFKVKTYAFYGHTEGCIMAYEVNQDNYIPLQSYGLAEAVKIEGDFNLVGTNFYNNLSPLIRYNTEDKIEDPKFDAGLLSSFNIKEGRKGDVILDKKNKKIPLTGLIFGRHHKLFDHCKHIQVSQKELGKATILFVPLRDIKFDAELLFDAKNIDVEFAFQELKNPVRTPSGKIKLLIH